MATEVFGETPMDKFHRLIAEERNRRNTYQKVEGSRTAPTTSGAQSMEAKEGPRSDMTTTGLVARLSSAGFKALMGLSKANTKDEIASVFLCKACGETFPAVTYRQEALAGVVCNVLDRDDIWAQATT